MSKNYFHAIATMMGTIIGVGMFSIPFIVHQSGIFLFIPFIIVLGFIQYYMHLMYAEIVLSTKKKHRVPGYVEEYYGSRYKKPSLIIILIAVNLSLLSYLIIGGIFMHQLFSPAFGGSQALYFFAMFLIAIALTYRGVKFIANVELAMSALLFLVVGIIVVKGFPYVSIDNYTSINWGNFFLPYGPIFMAIGGMTAVPTVCSLLAHKKDNIRSALFWGSIIPIFITIIFVLTIVGVSGAGTSPDSLLGLQGSLGNGVLLIALVFGLISIITSLIMVVEATKEIYWWDLGMNKMKAWILSLLIPLILFLVGVSNLTSVVAISGAFVGGIVSIIFVFLILRVKEKAQQKSIIKIKINNKIAFSLSLLFLFGFFTVLEYVELKTIALISFVFLFYFYSLIKSDKNNSSIYREFFETAKQTSLVFILIFFIALSFGVFSVVI